MNNNHIFCILTLYGPNSFVRRLSGYDIRQALFIVLVLFFGEHINMHYLQLGTWTNLSMRCLTKDMHGHDFL